VIGVVTGFLLSPVFFYLTFITAIHNGFRTGAYLFPLPVLISPEMNNIKVIALLLALLQWPLYGFVMALAFKSRTKLLAPWLVGFLIVQHVLIGHIARRTVESVPVRIKYEEDLH
jgi:hypothetical protein